jgi:orotate phosphoribosyltransferase
VLNQPQAVLDIFKQTGAYLTGHFRLTSGLHSNQYLQCARVLQYTDIAERLGAALASQLTSANPAMPVQTVIAPAIGGLIIGHEVARALKTRFIFTERDPNGGMILRRGFSIGKGEKLFVIEDVITTGGSAKEVVQLVQSLGADVLAAGSIIDRSNGAADSGVPRLSLATLLAETYTEAVCPMCAQGLPITKPGSRPS